MRVPWFDSNKGIWVPKDEFDQENKSAEAAVEEAESDVEGEVNTNERPKVTTTEKPKIDVVAELQANDEDLPF